MTTRILFASNGARPARDAGLLLRRVANPDLVEVTVHVCDSVEFAFAEDPWRMGELRRSRPEPKDLAGIEVAAFQEEGFQVDFRIGSGIPAEQILELVRSGDYAITLLGAGSSSWLGNLLLGSTSTKVLHASERSLLMVHRFIESHGKAKVVLATDGSADSDLAVSTFIEVADPKKVAVKVVSVVELLPIAPVSPTASELGAEVGSAAEKEAQERADRAADQLRDRGFDVATERPFGDPVKQILKRAADAALVVVGSRGLGAAGRLIMGSVSEQLARLAPATLICRKPDEDG